MGCDQADRCFHFRLDANDFHWERTLVITHESACLDAARGSDHIRLCQRCLDHSRIILQRKQWVAIDFLAIARSMYLDVTSKYADGIPCNGIIEAIHQTVIEHHHAKRE